MNPYEEAYQESIDPKRREIFWQRQAKRVFWYKFPSIILQNDRPPFAKWFSDGKINITANMFDRFLPQHADKRALVWVSNMVHQERTWTLKQAYEDTCRMILLLRRQGIKKGDRVIVYMPMIPEALFACWACARIGAIHSVVFGGFAAYELCGRIIDCDPAIVVTASIGIEPHKKINYVQILSEAISLSKLNPKVLIYQRPNLRVQAPNWIEFDLKNTPYQHVWPQQMLSTDYLYILYTSGTTGTPKGIVRDHGGTTVALQWTMNHIMGINLNDTYFAASDIGWVVGHSFIIYGPLLRGAATVLYEGKPTLPNPGALWSIVQRYKVNGLYTSPTGLRAIRKEDNEGNEISKYDLSSLEAVSMAGQRCDIPTYEWINSRLKILINDNYWQTECGWIISCNFKNLFRFPAKPGSATKPCPGFQVQILSELNQKVPIGTLGKVCIKLPMPPSFMSTLYKNDEVFLQKYMSESPGYYTTGDAGYFDTDNYLNVTTRLDDIINTAGHRLSTSAMQQVLLKHPFVSQAAVVAALEQIKGEIPVGIVVLKNNCSDKDIKPQLIKMMRTHIGPVACFNFVILVDKLPKTRSGKILRNVLRKMVQGYQYVFPSTIEDETVLDVVKQKIFQSGFGVRCKLLYRGEEEYLRQNFELQSEPKKKIH